MHTINEGWVYGDDGKKLTRTQAPNLNTFALPAAA